MRIREFLAFQFKMLHNYPRLNNEASSIMRKAYTLSVRKRQPACKVFQPISAWFDHCLPASRVKS